MQTVPVYQTEDIREIEKYLFSLDPKPHLMEIAGKTVADVALHVAPRDSQTALVLAGPGDNGGDAYVTARHLKNANYSVVVLSLSSPETVSQDRSRAIADWKEMGGLIKTNLDPEEHFDLVIDGLFGIGLTRPLSGDFADLVHQVNQLSS
ncbi:MAG: NAD(P)H-hydrate epimerase, partial [Burkholderiales bacterium]|nr:NAD(P)H-hydrate epimerase [Burkholderiales bacterium]